MSRTYSVASTVACSFRVDAVSSFDVIAQTMRKLEARGNDAERLTVTLDGEFIATVYWNGAEADVALAPQLGFVRSRAFTRPAPELGANVVTFGRRV